MIEDAGYLDRLERLVWFPFADRRGPAAQSRRLRRRRHHQPGGHRPRACTRRSSCIAGARRWSTSGSPPAAAASTASSTVRTIPAPRSSATGWTATAASRGPACCAQAAADLDLDLSRSFAVGDKWTDVQAGARRRRARASSCGPATAAPARRRRRRGVAPARDRRRPDRRDGVDSAAALMARAAHLTRSPARARRRLRRRARRGARRPARRRVHLRPDLARLARSAGPDPRIRLDRDRAGRRRQRREQRRRARRHAPSRSASTGDDEPGRRLLEAMRARIDVRHVVTHAALTTPTKTRILAGGVHSAKQQVVRVDRTARASRSPTTVREAIARRLSAALGRVRRAARLRLRHRARHAGARRGAQRAAARARAGCSRRCWSIRATRCSSYRRHDDVHAERVGSGAAARRARSARTRRVLERAGRDAADAHRRRRRC